MSRHLRMTQEQWAAWRRAHTPYRTEAPKPEPQERKVKVEYSRVLAQQIREAGLPEPILEYAFDAQLEGDGRRWQMDLCWPERRIGVEVDGAVHRIKERFKADIPKHQQAVRLGYLVLRVSPAQVMSGEALEQVRALLFRVVEVDGAGEAIACVREYVES